MSYLKIISIPIFLWGISKMIYSCYISYRTWPSMILVLFDSIMIVQIVSGYASIMKNDIKFGLFLSLTGFTSLLLRPTIHG